MPWIEQFVAFWQANNSKLVCPELVRTYYLLDVKIMRLQIIRRWMREIWRQSSYPLNHKIVNILHSNAHWYSHSAHSILMDVSQMSVLVLSKFCSMSWRWVWDLFSQHMNSHSQLTVSISIGIRDEHNSEGSLLRFPVSVGAIWLVWNHIESLVWSLSRFASCESLVEDLLVTETLFAETWREVVSELAKRVGPTQVKRGYVLIYCRWTFRNLLI